LVAINISGYLSFGFNHTFFGDAKAQNKSNSVGRNRFMRCGIRLLITD